MLRRVPGDLPDLPPGWDEGILASHWPDVLIGAVRRSAMALTSSRVVATIASWQHAARGASSPAQLEAKRRLAELHDALIGPAPSNIVDTDLLEKVLPAVRTRSLVEGLETAFTVDRFDLPPKPNLRRAPPPRVASAEPADDAIVAEDQDTDSKVKRVDARSAPMPHFSEDDDRPTYAFARPDLEPAPPSAPQPAAPPAPPPDSQSEIRRRLRLDEGARGSAPRPSPPPRIESNDDGLPTRHISIPEDLLRRGSSIAGRPEATVMATTPPAPRSQTPTPPPPPVEDDEATYALSADEAPVRPVRASLTPEPEEGRLAPKPGVIQRRSTRTRNSQAGRPRASMQHVLPRYALLKPFVEELLPLPVERRSRRFWARWREVAGERGARREVVEQLLETTHEVRALLCELIAEVEQAELKSVYALVDRLEANGGVEAARAQVQATPPERVRGQLLGAPVALDKEKD